MSPLSPVLIAVIVVVLVITLVLGAVVAYWVSQVDEYEEDGNYIRYRRLNGTLYVDESATVSKLTLEHRGGDRITWSDYRVTLDGTGLTAPRAAADNSSAFEAEVGETTLWWETSTARTVGTDYTVKVIDIETDTILWEKTLSAKVFQTPQSGVT